MVDCGRAPEVASSVWPLNLEVGFPAVGLRAWPPLVDPEPPVDTPRSTAQNRTFVTSSGSRSTRFDSQLPDEEVDERPDLRRWMSGRRPINPEGRVARFCESRQHDFERSRD